MVDDLLKRGKKHGVLPNWTDAGIEAVRTRPATLDDDQLAMLEKNGMTRLEREGRRVFVNGEPQDNGGDDED